VGMFDTVIFDDEFPESIKEQFPYVEFVVAR
jgi:hypothetical protein